MTAAGRARRAAALLALSAAGCIGGWRREYPAYWAALAPPPAKECPDVTGTWLDTPEEDPFIDYPPRLAVLLLGRDAPTGRRTPRPHHLRLQQPSPDALEIVLLGEDGTEIERNPLRRGHGFGCENGALVVDPPGASSNNNFCVGFESKRVALSRDVQGRLVARIASRDICVGLLNAWFWDTEWARFRPPTL